MVKAVIGGVTTIYVSANYQIKDGVVTKYYPCAMRVGSTLYYTLSDHLGSTSITIDPSGNKTETRYKAWGEVRYQSGTLLTDRTYTGQRSFTDDFGLMYYNARWYDSSIGRFSQADTVIPNGLQDYDRYAYVSNNPINFADPTGHKRVCTDNTYSGHIVTTCTGTDVVSPPQPVIVCNNYHGQEYENCVGGRDLKSAFDTYMADPSTGKTVTEEQMRTLIPGFSPLTPNEYALCEKNPSACVSAGVDAFFAKFGNWTLYPNDKNPDGPGNVFQHASWNIMMAKDAGLSFVEAFATAHETEANSGSKESHFMDLYNNKLGRRLVSGYPYGSVSALEGALYTAIANGEGAILVYNNFTKKEMIQFGNGDSPFSFLQK